MGPCRETPLGTLPGQSDRERVVVVLRHGSPEGSRIVLRQQSWGEGVGWFTQNSLEMAPDQVAALKAVLGPIANSETPRPSRRSATRQPVRATAVASALRLVQADSA